MGMLIEIFTACKKNFYRLSDFGKLLSSLNLSYLIYKMGVIVLIRLL